MKEREHDPVNQPAHYTQGKVECIDAIESALSPEEFMGFLRGQVLKYTWRCRLKSSSLEDLRKAAWYNDRLQLFIADAATASAPTSILKGSESNGTLEQLGGNAVYLSIADHIRQQPFANVRRCAHSTKYECAELNCTFPQCNCAGKPIRIVEP